MKRSSLKRKTPLKRGKTALKSRKPLKRVRSTLKRCRKDTVGKLKARLWEACKNAVRAKYAVTEGVWNCYTCGVLITKPKDAHTAHFVASSVSGGALRFDLRNLRICCGKCNIWLGGNFPAYYENMCKEIGKEATDALMAERHKYVKVDRHFYEKKLAEHEGLS